MAFYLDTSAATKLVVAEPASNAMASWAAAHEAGVVTSDLLRTELLRATRRSAPGQMQRARAVLDALPPSSGQPRSAPKNCAAWTPSISPQHSSWATSWTAS